MTLEDLQQARLHRWHQDGTPILTTEEVSAWLGDVGFCSLLPGTHPLASLAQAAAGSSDATPAREAQDAARQITAQLLQDRAAAPVMWEENSALTGELYDALVSAEVMPYLYCLRGDRDLKKAPAGSPLVQAVWEQLQDGARTVAEIVTGVGRELTEAAVLRALRELWEKLRVLPILELHASSEGARWDLTQRVFPDAVKQGATMSQPLALSAMVSVYLGGSVAATADEVEDALGPLASRSRVREVLNALQATRQLKMFPVGRSSAYALAGGTAEVLDEVAEKRDTDALKIARLEAKLEARNEAGKSPREFGERKAFVKREGIAARTRPRTDKPASDRESGAERKEWKPRPAAGPGFGVRKPYQKREGAGGQRTPYERKPYVKREGASGERKEWKPGAPGTRPAGSGFGDRKPAGGAPYANRESTGGERKEWKPRATGAGGGFGDRKPGAGRPYVKREGAAGERKEWKPRAPGGRPAAAGFAGRGERKPFVKREGDAGGDKREWTPRATGAGFGARKPFVKRDGPDGERKPYVRREAGAERSSRPAPPAGERREWKARPAPGPDAGERKPFAKKPFGSKPGGPRSFGSKPFGSKPGGRTFARKPFGAKPFGAKPFGAKSFGAKSGGTRPPIRKKPEGRKDDEA